MPTSLQDYTPFRIRQQPNQQNQLILPSTSPYNNRKRGLPRATKKLQRTRGESCMEIREALGLAVGLPAAISREALDDIRLES